MNIKYYDECVRYALQQHGIQADTFKDTNYRVYERHVANPKSVFSALRKHGIVIPAVVDTLFGGTGFDLHACVIVSANQLTGEVSLYVPQAGEEQSFPISSFINAWEAAAGICTTAFVPDEKTYSPKLLDLKHIELPTVYDELREAIAENAHDTWAMERQSEGWTWGPKRDDSKLETPDMVPYDKLPESEKQYDRLMAADTLRLLIALGYRIERNV
ncbi:MAG: hypothetical protein IJ570_00735 [Prevotella sp.]|nr:hypothetical protein [Prevotella sp.]